LSVRWIAIVVLAACGDDATITPHDSGPCTDTHDEDGDGIGDKCDDCPAAADPAQRDTTEAATMIVFPDGIGDACDPRPALSGDKLGALHTFFDPAAAAAWNGSGWTIADDLAHATASARWVHRTSESGDGLFVQARLAQLAWDVGGRFEIAIDGDGVGSGYGCAIVKDTDNDGNDELEAREAVGTPMSKSVNMAITGAITLTAWRFFDPQRRGTIRCRVTFDANNATLDIPTVDDFPIGIYGFASEASTTDVSSLVVYTQPPLPKQ